MRRLALILFIVVTAPSAWAQSLDVQHGRLTPGTTGLAVVQGARTETPRTWRLGVDLQYMLRPLVVSNDGQVVSPVVSDQLGLHLRAAWAVTQGVDFGASLALVPFEHIGAEWHGNGFVRTSRNVAGVGDLYLQARFQVARQERVGVDIALVPVVYVPSFMSNFMSGGGFVFAPEVDIDRRFGDFLLALNVGLALRKEHVVDGLDLAQQFSWRAGLGYSLARLGLPERSQLAFETFGLVPLASPDAANTPAEWLISGRYAWPSWLGTIGVGSSFSSGYGAPQLRVLASVSWAPTKEEATPLAVAGEPAAAQDTDDDGVPDGKDDCPKDKETLNGYQDEDGCPDVSDKDGDGIIDDKDQCPEAAEDVDGFEDDDGCPDPDNDQDSIPDKLDKCPDQAEDFDGVEDEDGCPDVDADDDGIPDAKDKCPLQAEVINGTADEDGCPDEGEQLVELKGTSVELKGTFFFGIGSDVLLKRAFALLNQLTALLKNHAEMHILVEGYSDADGNAAANLRLSKRRADSVKRYLINHGIDGARIKTEGFGESRPRAANTDARSRALNRRVNITVLKDELRPAQGKGALPPAAPLPDAPASSGLDDARQTATPEK